MKFTSTKKEFVPFDFTMKIESKVEADLIYKLFNLTVTGVESDIRHKLTDVEKQLKMDIYVNYAKAHRPDIRECVPYAIKEKQTVTQQVNDLKKHEKTFGVDEVLPDMSVGKIIKGLRKRDAIRQYELAKRMKICVTTLSRIEQGHIGLTEFRAIQLSKIFNIGIKVFKKGVK